MIKGFGILQRTDKSTKSETERTYNENLPVQVYEYIPIHLLN
jgi:hypothetical protein